MISLDPLARLTCSEYLEKYRESAFPGVFWRLHPFLADINDIGPAQPSAILSANRSANPANGVSTPMNMDTTAPLRIGADEKLARIWAEFDRVLDFFEGGNVRPVGDGGKASTVCRPIFRSLLPDG